MRSQSVVFCCLFVCLFVHSWLWKKASDTSDRPAVVIQPRLKTKKKLPELVWSSRGDVVGHAEEQGKGWVAGGGAVWVSDDITAGKKVEAFQIANRQFPFSSCAPHFFRPHFSHFFSAAREKK